MNGLEEVELYCPYCSEPIVVMVDRSEPQQQYVEDCEVCCSPIVLSVNIEGSGWPRVEAERENG